MIYFIRHGQSEANLRGVFADYSAGLTGEGRQQVLHAAKEIKFSKIKFNLIISSDIKRAKQTAEIIADNIGFDSNKIIYDSRIREYDVGSMENKAETNVSSYKLTHAAKAEDPLLFQKRVESFLDQYKNSRKNILMVSHAGVARMIQVIKNNLNPADFYDLPSISNADLTKLNLEKFDYPKKRGV